MRFHHPDRSFDQVQSRPDDAHVPKRYGKPDSSVATHPEIPDIIEEDHTGRASLVEWLAKQRSNHRVRTARLIDCCRSKTIELTAKLIEPFCERTVSKWRTAVDDDARRLASSVRIDHMNTVHTG
jgi:hypothetical protein